MSHPPGQLVSTFDSSGEIIVCLAFQEISEVYLKENDLRKIRLLVIIQLIAEMCLTARIPIEFSLTM